MGKDLSGWTWKDLTVFLSAHCVCFEEQGEGSCEIWIIEKDGKQIKPPIPIDRLHDRKEFQESEIRAILHGRLGLSTKKVRKWRQSNASQKKKIAKENKEKFNKGDFSFLD